jgi:hypothetical protein
MIKLSGVQGDGRPIIILGLSEMNVTKLREKMPIHINADELGFPGEIVIILGDTEDSLAKELHELISERTRVADHRGEKRS